MKKTFLKKKNRQKLQSKLIHVEVNGSIYMKKIKNKINVGSSAGAQFIFHTTVFSLWHLCQQKNQQSS